ncbi:MAG: DUF3137 domain-containing protein [Tannerellaceae bacterium]|nr:DUF3137 domain-containing protein [Tannerellaceae bacterium]
MEPTKQTAPSFNQLIDRLEPDLQKVEKTRRQRQRKALLITLAVTGVCGALSLLSYIRFPGAFHIVLGICIFLEVGIVGTLLWFQSKAVSEEYKFSIVTPFVEALVEEGIYIPSAGIEENDFVRSNLFRQPDRYSSEDMITGKVGETRISFSKVHAQEKHQTTNSKGQTRTHWKDIFRGFIFIADFSKEFRCDIQVKRTKMFASKTNRVYLEDPEFEKNFNTYCTDQIEARYILTPSTMRRIMELENKFRGKNMMISFRNNSILIAVSDATNHFEASIWRSVFNTRKLKREYEIIRAFAEIVEDLNLNLRIWSKQE